MTESLNFMVKWFHMGSANGNFAPIVLLISMSELLDEDLFTFEVPGINSMVNNSISNIYVCFTKTRNGNKKILLLFLIFVKQT